MGIHMAVRRRRILVTPSDEAWAVVDEVHRLTGQPRASLVAELLDVALPSLQATIEALRIVREQPDQARLLLHNYTSTAIAQAAQASLDLDAALDGRTVRGKRAKGGGLRGRTS